jgi:hypothetical protein
LADSDIDTNLGMSRRTLIKRGAILGGTLVWAAPAITHMSSAGATPARRGSPACTGHIEACVDPDGPGVKPEVCGAYNIVASVKCCSCLDAYLLAHPGKAIAAANYCAFVTEACDVTLVPVG